MPLRLSNYLYSKRSDSAIRYNLWVGKLMFVTSARALAGRRSSALSPEAKARADVPSCARAIVNVLCIPVTATSVFKKVF